MKTYAFQAKYIRAFDDETSSKEQPNSNGYKDQKHDCAIKPASSGYLQNVLNVIVKKDPDQPRVEIQNAQERISQKRPHKVANHGKDNKELSE